MQGGEMYFSGKKMNNLNIFYLLNNTENMCKYVYKQTLSE